MRSSAEGMSNEMTDDDDESVMDDIGEFTTAEKVSLARRRMTEDAERCGTSRTIDDVWDLFGSNSTYYVRHMAFCGSAYGGSIMYASLVFSSTLKASEYISDCNMKPYATSIVLSKDAKINIADAHIDPNILSVIQFQSLLFGIFLLFLMRNVDRRKILLATCASVSVSAICTVLVPFDHVKHISLFITNVCTRIIVNLMFIACVENVPKHLRPLAVFTCFFLVWNLFGSVLIRSPWLSPLLIWIISSSITCGSLLLHYFFVPLDVMAGVVRKDVVQTKKAILPFVADDKHADYEGLIDDVIFAGEVTVNESRQLIDVLTNKPFMLKLILLTAVNLLTKGARDSKRARFFLPYEIYEHGFIENIGFSIACISFLGLVTAFGRRFTVIFGGMIIVISHVCLATADNYINEGAVSELTFSFACYMGTIIGFTGVDFVSTLMLLEHMPHRLRASGFSLLQIFLSLSIFMMRKALPVYGSGDEVRVAYLHPHAGLALISLVISLFLDDTPYSPLSFNEIDVYDVQTEFEKGRKPVIFVSIAINDIRFTALVDLESPVSKISTSVAAATGLRNITEGTVTLSRERTTENPPSSEATVRGKLKGQTTFEVKLDFANHELQTPMTIVPRLRNDVVLGRELLEDYGATLDFKRWKLILGDVASDRFLPSSRIPTKIKNVHF